MEPFAQLGEDLVDLLCLLVRHGLEGRDADAAYAVESKTRADEVDVFDDLVPAEEPLSDDAGESLAKEARAVTDEGKAVNERLHPCGDLEHVVRRCKDDSVRSHHLLDQDVAVVLVRTDLFSLLETQLAADAEVDSVVGEIDDLAIDVLKPLQMIEQAANSVVGVLCTCALPTNAVTFFIRFLRRRVAWIERIAMIQGFSLGWGADCAATTGIFSADSGVTLRGTERLALERRRMGRHTGIDGLVSFGLRIWPTSSRGCLSLAPPFSSQAGRSEAGLAVAVAQRHASHSGSQARKFVGLI